MQRKIYDKLLDWKNNSENNKPMMVLGVRQCGKTYIIEEFCKREYKKHYTLNLFQRADIIDLYKSRKSSSEKYLMLKSLINFDFDEKDSILFIDEIQESEELISDLKYFCEEHNNVKVICAGSLLGVKLKRLSKSFPVGKVWRLNLYPMDFEEFLMAFNENMLIDYMKECFINNKPMDILHDKAMYYYRNYLITGGMPESIMNMVKINNDYINYDKRIVSNIIESYFDDMKKYVESSSESLKIRRLYNSLPNQLSNSSHKFQYSKIDKKAKSRDYELPLDWLMSSNMVLKVNSVKNPQIPLKGFENPDVFKLFFSDIGILNNLLEISVNDILNDNLEIYKGIITENYVANQLVSNNIPIYYWKNNDAEVDFLISTSDDGVIPIEVKSSLNTQAKSLKVYINKYNPNYSIKLSTKDFSYDPKNKIKIVPLYATFLIKNLIK